ncbi:hypothetical protein WJX74_007739 [Apatococcus lobatus]|uniref:Uncharacterized protein n=1 Tax=Apatococcus lobatus TaxID=904363 RepID=A0AAW1R258_9CHLO
MDCDKENLANNSASPQALPSRELTEALSPFKPSQKKARRNDPLQVEASALLSSPKVRPSFNTTVRSPVAQQTSQQTEGADIATSTDSDGSETESPGSRAQLHAWMKELEADCQASSALDPHKAQPGPSSTFQQRSLHLVHPNAAEMHRDAGFPAEKLHLGGAPTAAANQLQVHTMDRPAKSSLTSSNLQPQNPAVVQSIGPATCKIPERHSSAMHKDANALPDPTSVPMALQPRATSKPLLPTAFEVRMMHAQVMQNCHPHVSAHKLPGQERVRYVHVGGHGLHGLQQTAHASGQVMQAKQHDLPSDQPQLSGQVPPRSARARHHDADQPQHVPAGPNSIKIHAGASSHHPSSQQQQQQQQQQVSGSAPQIKSSGPPIYTPDLADSSGVQMLHGPSGIPAAAGPSSHRASAVPSGLSSNICKISSGHAPNIPVGSSAAPAQSALPQHSAVPSPRISAGLVVLPSIHSSVPCSHATDVAAGSSSALPPAQVPANSALAAQRPSAGPSDGSQHPAQAPSQPAQALNDAPTQPSGPGAPSRPSFTALQRFLIGKQVTMVLPDNPNTMTLEKLLLQYDQHGDGLNPSVVQLAQECHRIYYGLVRILCAEGRGATSLPDRLERLAVELSNSVQGPMVPLPAGSTRRSHGIYNGKLVIRKFLGSSMELGTVIGLGPNGIFQRVRYTNGHQEELEDHEVLESIALREPGPILEMGRAGQELIYRRGSFVEVVIRRTEADSRILGSRICCRIEDLFTVVSTGQRYAVIRKFLSGQQLEDCATTQLSEMEQQLLREHPHWQTGRWACVLKGSPYYEEFSKIQEASPPGLMLRTARELQPNEFVECLGLEARLLVPIHHIQGMADPVFPRCGLLGWPENCQLVSLDHKLCKLSAAAGLLPTQTALFAKWAEQLASEAFIERMLRKRANFNVDTNLSMPEESFRALFLHSGLAELTEGFQYNSRAQASKARGAYHVKIPVQKFMAARLDLFIHGKWPGFPVVATPRSGTTCKLEVDTNILLCFTPGPKLGTSEPMDGSLRVRYSFKSRTETAQTQPTADSSQLQLLETLRQYSA